MSYYNMLLSQAAYNIIRSNLSDTVAHDSLFVIWQDKLGTYTTAQNMVDYYISKGDYVTVMNKVDSLPINFTLSTYDSAEYNYYYDLKDMQTTWLDSGRDIFSLTTSEICDLQTIADSSRGTAGAQARGLLNFVLDTTYFYTNCISVSDTSQKTLPIESDDVLTKETACINVSPNPANNSITFDFSFADDFNSGYLIIVNSAGKIVKRFKVFNKMNQLSYNTSRLPSGMYYYKFVSGHTLESGKLVINH